jgi:hypothetical protein
VHALPLSIPLSLILTKKQQMTSPGSRTKGTFTRPIFLGNFVEHFFTLFSIRDQSKLV